MSTRISVIKRDGTVNPAINGIGLGGLMFTAGVTYTDDAAVIADATAYPSSYLVAPGDPQLAQTPVVSKVRIGSRLSEGEVFPDPVQIGSRLRDAAVDPQPPDYKPAVGGTAPGLSRLGEVT